MSPPVLTAQAVADLVGGRLLGEGTLVVSAIASLHRAEPECLSFLVSPRYLSYFRSSRAGAVLMAPEFADQPEGPATRIVVPDPYRAILSLLPRFVAPVDTATGIHSSAVVADGVILDEGVSLGPHVVVGPGCAIGTGSRLEAGTVLEPGVTVGRECHLGAGVVCHAGTRLGDRVVLKAGAVIGGPGFGFLPSPAGHQRIPHAGRCILEDDVEIGSNSTVDRGSIDDTVIGRGTKIDNLVHIAHNIRIGEHCLIMAMSGMAGSASLGDWVVLAGGVGVADHVRVGSGAKVSARSTVISEVPDGAVHGGYPARPHRDFLRAQGALYRLAPLAKELETLATERKHRAKKND